MVIGIDQIRQLRENNEGTLPSFAWPGGYPIFYLDAENSVLCPSCANKEEGYSSPTVAADCNWEDACLFCDDCSERIPSAYAEEEVDTGGEDWQAQQAEIALTTAGL